MASRRRPSSALRLAAIGAVAILACVRVSGQAPATAANPYGLDPYRPSDAELLRRYGSVLVAQTPLGEIRKLDPYKPSDAALLRELGGGIPLWGWWYPPTPFSGPLMLPSAASAEQDRPQINIFVGQPPSDALTAIGTPASPSLPREIVTVLRPDTNDGVWINYDNARWISAGQAVAFDEGTFTRIGQYNGFPVFRRQGSSDEVIYLPTRKDRVSPYRLKGK